MNDSYGSEGERLSKGDCAIPDYANKLCAARHESLYVRLQAMDKALELNAKNVEARLMALNELRAEVIKDRVLFIREDMYTSKHGDLERWVRSVDSAVNALSVSGGILSKLETRLTILETRLVTISAGIVFLVALIQTVFYFLRKG